MLKHSEIDVVVLQMPLVSFTLKHTNTWITPVLDMPEEEPDVTRL